jgi:uncharacterized membrane protein YciS (DUF1049 family)
MRTRIIAGLAIILTAIALVGCISLCPSKQIGLAQDDYLVAQSLYRGWSLFGVVLIGSLAANAALAILLRGQGMSFYLVSRLSIAVK